MGAGVGIGGVGGQLSRRGISLLMGEYGTSVCV